MKPGPLFLILGLIRELKLANNEYPF